MQTGGVEVSVQFDQGACCWTYRCLWGCFGFDYESEHEAREAFLGHSCEA